MDGDLVPTLPSNDLSNFGCLVSVLVTNITDITIKLMGGCFCVVSVLKKSCTRPCANPHGYNCDYIGVEMK